MKCWNTQYPCIYWNNQSINDVHSHVLNKKWKEGRKKEGNIDINKEIKNKGKIYILTIAHYLDIYNYYLCKKRKGQY